jgi:lipid A ethanolaminephosphotransferase
MTLSETRRPIRPAWAAAAACGWMATVGNLALWRELDSLGLLQARGGWLLAATLAAATGALLFALVSLFAWRGLLKPMVLLLLAITALGAHFMLTFHVVIDPGMAANVLQSDWGEARALLGPHLAATLVVGFGLPAWWLARARVVHRPWRRQAAANVAGCATALLVACMLVLASFQPLAASMRSHKQLRYLLNPLNSLYAAAHAAAGPRTKAADLLPVGRDAQLAPSGGRPPLLVLVLGETARSGNFGVNGYERDTTPRLAGAGVASFRNAWSCGTSTAASVPCMFSPLGREAFLARSQDTENLLDVLRHAGLGVLWLDNQPGGCKGVCDRVRSANLSATTDFVLCPTGTCFDGVLADGLDARLAALPEAERAHGVVLVLHQMGSHGPAYSERSPPAFKRFLPECTSAHLPDCSPEALRNAYDNSIAYTDHVLGNIIDWLRQHTDFDTGLLYVADHGESLGENNLYLHGLPYALAPDVQKHVPWVTWLSAGLQDRSGVGMECLRRRAAARITHDHLFHSVLGLLQVQTTAYKRALDAYAECAAH